MQFSAIFQNSFGFFLQFLAILRRFVSLLPIKFYPRENPALNPELFSVTGTKFFQMYSYQMPFLDMDLLASLPSAFTDTILLLNKLSKTTQNLVVPI